MRNILTRIKYPLLILGLSLCVPLTGKSADNLLANGDFSQGSESWGGDASDDDSSAGASQSVDPSDSSGHIVIHLREELASRIYQSFESRDSDLAFSIVCNVSPDCKFIGEGKVADIADDIEEHAPSIDMPDSRAQATANDNYAVYSSVFRAPVLLLVDRDNNKVTLFSLTIKPGGGEQKAACSFRVQTHKSYELYIAFPPGEGSIIVTNVSLSTT